MEATLEGRYRDRARRGPAFPAYGPVDAALGYWLFSVVVDRATPTVVAVFSERVLDLSPATVTFGLAAVLWVVLAVKVIDQFASQVRALTGDGDETRLWVPALVPRPYWVLAYGLVTALAGSVAVVTFQPGVDATVTLFESVATLDVAAILLLDVGAVVVFYLAFAVASYCLDRLVIRTVRVALGN